MHIQAAASEGNSYFIINGELYIQKLREDFRRMDVDGSGEITKEDLEEMARQSNYILSKEELEETIKGMDNDGDGKISVEEFIASAVRWCCCKMRSSELLGTDISLSRSN